MKTINLLLALFIGGLLSCNAQQLQNREVLPFQKIQASGAVNVIYSTSDTLSLSLKGKDRDLEKVETKVENNTLIISNKKNLSDPITVYVKSNQLNGVELSGATEFKATNTIKSTEMELNVTGSAHLKMDLETSKTHCQQSGASNMVLKGKTDEFTAEVTGASSLKAYQFEARQAKVTATGASSARIHATEVFKANATGASDVKVKGDPKEVSAESGGAASITRIKDVADKDLDKDTDTTSYNWKNKKFMVINDHKCGEGDNDCGEDDGPSFKHWTGFSMGVNGYMGPQQSLSMQSPNQFLDLNYSRSFNFQFNIIERQFDLVQNYMKVITGFGFDWHLYEFSNRTNLNPDTSFTWGIVDAGGSEKYLKNKLRCTYLQVPLLLEFNTSNDPEKTVHVALGVIGQYMIASRSKQVIEDQGYEYKKVRKDNFNLSPFAAKAHVNMGYRGFTVFAEYGLTSLFQAGKGPELYPFAAGIRLVPFS